MADARTAGTRAPTQANADYLAPGFLDEVLARYGGTRLGRQGYQMLCRLAPKSGRALVTHVKTGGRISGASVNMLLKRWMARQEWRDDGGEPFAICSHQFRPTFAQQIIAADPKMNEYALKAMWARAQV